MENGRPASTTRARPAARLPESAARRRGARSHARRTKPRVRRCRRRRRRSRAAGECVRLHARVEMLLVLVETPVGRIRYRRRWCRHRPGLRSGAPNASLLSRPHSEAHPNEVYLLRPWHSLLTRITTSPTSRTSSYVPSPVPSRARAARASRASPRRDPVTPRRSAPHAPPAPRAEPQGRQVVRHAPLARRAASRRFRPPRAPRAPRRNRDAAYPEVAAGPPKPPPPRRAPCDPPPSPGSARRWRRSGPATGSSPRGRR